jgi:glycosyltransferase involved in cell wall biosynthesis
MRIAYIAPYQGAGLLKNRPCLRNLSLQSSSHRVEIISQGAVDRSEFRFYPPFAEKELFDPNIPIDYLSALPVRFLRGFWEGISAQRVLKARHDRHPYDAIIIYSMSSAQVRCAQYAIQQLRVPVILEYEDDAFVDVYGRPGTGLDAKEGASLISKYRRRVFKDLLNTVSGVIAPSPYLLSQCPEHVRKALVRAVVSDEILRLRAAKTPKKNWVAFSGTHERSQGLEQLVKAWRILQLPEWELHIAGKGPLTPVLEKIADGDPSIVFHGLLDRKENAKMLCAAKIGMNPQDVTQTPGNAFAFKIVEYLAAGAHVISTPRGALEPELEVGVTYIQDNSPETIVSSLKQAIENSCSALTAEHAAMEIYGPTAVSKSLNNLLTDVVARNGKKLTA